MSLIDEALRRAQAAHAEPGRPGDRPWVPAPLPDAGLSGRRRFFRVLAIAAAMALGAVAGIIFVRNVGTSEAPAHARERGSEARPAPAALPTAAVSTAVPSPPVPTEPARPRSTRPPAAQVGAASAPLESVAVPEPPARPQALVDGRTYAGAVSLPDGARVELGGIVWSEAEPRAWNGTLIRRSTN